MIIGEILRQAPGEHSRRVKRSIVYKTLEIFCSAVPYAVIYQALKMLLDGEEWGTRQISLLTGITAAALLGQFLFGVKGSRYAFISGYGMFGDFRLKLLEHLSRLPLGFFQKKQVGALTATVTENVKMVEDIFTKLFGELISCLALPTFIAIILLFVDWRMGLAALASAPLAFVVLRASQNYFTRLSASRINSQAEASGRLLEYIDGIKVIKSFGLAGKKFSVLESTLKAQRNLAIKLEVLGGLAIMLFAIVLEIGFIAILVVGAYAMLGGELSAPVYLMGMVISQKYFAPFTRAGFLLVDIKYLELAYARIKEILKEPELPEAANPVALEPGDITFEDVSFSYDEEDQSPALDSVSLKIEQGKTTALVGPSGAGKSTVAHLIGRFYDITGGSIKIGGTDIRQTSFAGLMGNISMVLQDVYMFNDSIAANIRLGKPEATDEEVIEAARGAQCHDFVIELPDGYNTLIGEGGAKLSGGQKQRLAIARALLKKAPILLLDESTASIDPENELAFRQALAELSQGKTVLIIAHRLNTIASADEIIVMNKGRVVQNGTHSALLKEDGVYADLWQAAEFGG